MGLYLSSAYWPTTLCKAKHYNIDQVGTRLMQDSGRKAYDDDDGGGGGEKALLLLKAN